MSGKQAKKGDFSTPYTGSDSLYMYDDEGIAGDDPSSEEGEHAKRLTLLWVLDPSYQSPTKTSAATRSDWFKTTRLPVADTDGDLQRCLYPVGKDMFLVNQYIYIYLRLPNDSYDKRTMPWTEFKDIIMKGDHKRLENFNIVIPPFVATDLWDEIYGFKGHEVTLYLEILGRLDEGSVTFWPSIAECRLHADKWKQVKFFDKIALQVTKTCRPFTRLVDMERYSTNKGVVKRTFSHSAAHVFLPHKLSKGELVELSRPETKFLQQTYMPTLRCFGELRVGVSCSKVIWRTWTFPKEDGTWEHQEITSPQKIVGVPFIKLPQWPFDNDHAQLSTKVAENQEDIDSFALTSLQALIDLEKKELGFEPSLAAFARVDIGITIDPEFKAQLFINEVESGPGVCLWGGHEKVDPVFAVYKHALYMAGKNASTLQ